MKLRSIVSVGVMALAAAAFADDYSDGAVVGWARVDSPNARTVIGVPWLKVDGDGAVEVAKLVQTSSLTAGDKLYVFDDGMWYFYELDANKAWVAGTTAHANADPVLAGDPATARVTRGKALILERQSTANPFYLYGKDGALSAGELTATVAAGGDESSTLTLLASPRLEEIDVNSKSGFITGTIADGDSIIMPVAGGNTVSYTRQNGSWVRETIEQVTMPWGAVFNKKVYTSVGCTIPLGTGFWYSRAAGQSALTINW